MTGKSRSTGRRKPKSGAKRPGRPGKRCGDLPMKDYRRPTQAELAALHQLGMRGPAAPVSRTVIARVLTERDQLVFVATAARHLVLSAQDAGLVGGSGSTDPTPLDKAFSVLTHAIETWEAESGLGA